MSREFVNREKASMERDIRQVLADYAFQRVDFFRFGGNYGDSLIWHGTVNLLREFGIEANYTTIDANPQNPILFVDGGGNLVDYYSDVREFLHKKLMAYAQVLILPHTIYGAKQVGLLGRFKRTVTTMCRERVSFEFVKQHAKKSNVILWRDCAFYCQAYKEYNLEGEGVLNAFRTDCESIYARALPSDNIDISRNGYATKPLHDLLSTIAHYEAVNTDRLHVAIASLMLGKKVRLFSNSYFKNRAVFDYSLRDFPDISFVDVF